MFISICLCVKKKKIVFIFRRFTGIDNVLKVFVKRYVLVFIIIFNMDNLYF